jgi:hypothetical protein
MPKLNYVKKFTYYSISGRVLSVQYTGRAGVTVSLGSHSTVTDANGMFTLGNLLLRTSGTLTATKTGHTFHNREVSSLSSNLENFGITEEGHPSP